MPKKPTTPAEHHRNRVRGILGTARSSNPKRRAIDLPGVYRSGLRRALLDARSSLSSIERTQFLRWFDLATRNTGDAIEEGLALDLLTYFIPTRRISLSDELEWVAARLQRHVGTLAAFQSAAAQINVAFWSADRELVEGLLAGIEDTFGHSMWLIETRIACAQFYDGLEAQKQYLTQLRQTQKGLPMYFAHFISVRNEDRSTLRLFRDDLCERLENTKLSDDAKTYLKYKVGDIFPQTEGGIAALLRIEQGQSVFDLYECVIDVAQRLVKTGRAAAHREVLLKILESVKVVDDYRLDKLAIALGLPPDANAPKRCSRAAELINAGNIHRAYSAARRKRKANPHDPWPAIEMAVCLALRSDDRLLQIDITPDFENIPILLAQVLVRGSEFDNATRRLEKFCRNFHTLPTAAALGDFVGFALGTLSLGPDGLFASALNSPYFGPEDVILAHAGSRASLRASFMSLFTDGHMAPYLRLLLLSRDEDLAQAFVEAAAQEIAAVSSPMQTMYANLRTTLALELDDLDAAVSFISAEVSRRPAARSALPVAEALANRPWSVLKNASDKLGLALCLEIYVRRTNDDLRATHLRFAFEDFLATTTSAKPSLLEVDGDPRKLELVQFLRFVCLPSIMDQSGLFASSRELSDERIAVCETLSVADPENAETYNDEILTIRRNLLIQDGLQIVDSSRVHVDTTAISRWAERRYLESFARYEALVKAGIGIAEDLEELIRTVVRSKGDEFTVPDSEADTLLLEMILAIAHQFLHDPEHGLHFYLGKRIRHGTITGHLRGPLEIAGLITQRTSEHGSYLPNSRWLDQLSFISSGHREEADRAFGHFAARYDELTADLKDKYLHVHSKAHPHGLFGIVVTPVAFHLIRSTVQRSLSFQNFLLTCYSMYWAFLTPSLSEARSLLEEKSKVAAVELLDQLQERMRRLAINDTSYLLLSTAIREASLAVQTQFDTTADWFKRTEAETVAHLFPLTELVDIAIQNALKTHKGFSPNITKSIQGNLSASASSLITVVDIIFVPLDNACRRAECGSTPNIEIQCFFNEAKETIEFLIINPVGPAIDRQASEKVLQEIRDKIERGEIRDGAQSARGSGLMQIASITRRSPKSLLEFGYRDDNTFFTRVVVAAIMQGPSVAISLEGSDA